MSDSDTTRRSGFSFTKMYLEIYFFLRLLSWIFWAGVAVIFWGEMYVTAYEKPRPMWLTAIEAVYSAGWQGVKFIAIKVFATSDGHAAERMPPLLITFNPHRQAPLKKNIVGSLYPTYAKDSHAMGANVEALGQARIPVTQTDGSIKQLRFCVVKIDGRINAVDIDTIGSATRPDFCEEKVADTGTAEQVSEAANAACQINAISYKDEAGTRKPGTWHIQVTDTPKGPLEGEKIVDPKTGETMYLVEVESGPYKNSKLYTNAKPEDFQKLRQRPECRGQAEAKLAQSQEAPNAKATQINLSCDDIASNGTRFKSFIWIDPVAKYVKVQELSSTFEFKDGVYGKALTDTKDPMVSYMSDGPGRQFVDISDDAITFGIRLKKDSDSKLHRIDRNNGVWTVNGGTPTKCTVLPSQRQF